MNNFDISGDIDDVLIRRCIDRAEHLDTPDNLPFTLVINSDGGNGHGAMHLGYRLLRQLKGRELVTVADNASSAAALLFLFGKRRIVRSNSRLFFHGATFFVQILPSEVTPKSILLKRKTLTHIVRSRLGMERLILDHSNITRDEVERFMRDDRGRSFNAQESLCCGLATEISDTAFSGDQEHQLMLL